MRVLIPFGVPLGVNKKNQEFEFNVWCSARGKRVQLKVDKDSRIPIFCVEQHNGCSIYRDDTHKDRVFCALPPPEKPEPIKPFFESKYISEAQKQSYELHAVELVKGFDVDKLKEI